MMVHQSTLYGSVISGLLHCNRSWVQGSEIVGPLHKPACHARRENISKEQVIGAVQGVVEEANRC